MSEPNPEMIIVTLVRGDHWVGRGCPNCLYPFKAAEEVFESADQVTAIHVTCVMALALVATLRSSSDVAVKAEYMQVRDELFATIADRSPDE